MSPLDETLPPAEPPRLAAGAASPSAEQSERAAKPDETSALASVSTAGEITLDFVPGNSAGVDARVNRRDDAANSGQRFGNYELLEPLGSGGMGVVYKARQRGLNRLVALKRIRAGELAEGEQVQRFYAEAEAAAALDHSGIVPIYEVGDVAGQPFFSMGYVAGESLQQRLLAGPVEPREAATIVEQVAQAVEYAHQQGVIHRDLKPGNILLDSDGHPRVTDFGLAKRNTVDSGLTLSGQVLGTPAYMPPEQARGQHERVGPRSDVYGLGAVLYAGLTGRPPFQAASFADTLRQVIEKDPAAPRALNPSIPVDLESITLKCLEKDLERRYASAADLAADLRRWQEGLPIVARPVSRIERLARWARRNPVLAGLLSLSALLLVAVSVVSTAAWLRASADAEAKSRLADEKSKLADDMSKLAREKTKLANEKTTLAGEMTVLAGKESRARTETERQLRIATANRLAAQSTSLLNERPITALLLAAAAAEATPGEPMTPGAELALREGVARVGGYPLTGHGQRPYYLRAVSPNGRWFAAGDSHSAVTLWDLDAPDPNTSAKTLSEHVSNSVTFSLNSRWLASAGLDRYPSQAAAVVAVRIWDLDAADTGAEPRVLQSNVTSGGAPSRSVISNRGNRVAWMPAGVDPVIRYADIDVDTTELSIKSLNGQEGQTIRALSDSGRWLVTTSRDGVRRWDLDADDPAGQSEVLWRPAEGGRGDIQISSNGTWLIINGAKLAVWNLEAELGVKPRTISFGDEVHEAVSWLSVDGLILLARRGDFLHAWDISSLQPRTPQRLNLTFLKLSDTSFSVDHRWSITREDDDKRIHIEDLHPNGRQLTVNYDASGWHNWDAGNQRLVAGNRDEAGRVWDIESPDGAANPKVLTFEDRIQPISSEGRLHEALVARLRSPLPRHRPDNPTITEVPGTHLATSPDGRWLVTVEGNDGTARLYDLHSPGPDRLSYELQANVAPAFSPDSRWLAMSDGTMVRLWDLSTASQDWRSKELLGHKFAIRRIKFSLDSRRLITSDHNAIHLWNLESPDPAADSKVHPLDFGDALAISSDCRWMVTGSGNVIVRKWDLEAPASAANPRILQGQMGSKSGFVLSPNDRWLVVEGGPGAALHVWDMRLADPPAHPVVLTENSGRLQSGKLGTFSPNSRWFATGDGDAARVWDLDAPVPAATCKVFRGHASRVSNAAFSSDSRWLVTTSTNDAKVRLWLFDPDDHLQLAKAVAGRPLTDDERAEFDVPAYTAESQVMGPAFRPGLPPLLMHQWPARLPVAVGAEQFAERAFAHANVSRWREAQEDYRRAREARPSNVEYWYADALTLLGAGDQSGYEEICNEVLEEFGKSDMRTASRAAQICALGPDAVKGEQWAEVREMAERVITAAPENWNCFMRLGAVCYRSGDHSAAIKHLKRAASLSEGEAHVWIQLFLAMAHHQTQQPEEARRWLELAERHIERDARQLEWGDRLLFQLNLTEARALLLDATPGPGSVKPAASNE